MMLQNKTTSAVPDFHFTHAKCDRWIRHCSEDSKERHVFRRPNGSCNTKQEAIHIQSVVRRLRCFLHWGQGKECHWSFPSHISLIVLRFHLHRTSPYFLPIVCPLAHRNTGKYSHATIFSVNSSAVIPTSHGTSFRGDGTAPLIRHHHQPRDFISAFARSVDLAGSNLNRPYHPPTKDKGL
jgi:hypothetical protein